MTWPEKENQVKIDLWLWQWMTFVRMQVGLVCVHRNDMWNHFITFLLDLMISLLLGSSQIFKNIGYTFTWFKYKQYKNILRRSVACTHIPICPLPPYLLSGENHIYSFIVDSSSVYLLQIKENIDKCLLFMKLFYWICTAFCMSITPQ